MKTAKFANRLDPDEVAHHKPPHLDPHGLPSRLWILKKKYDIVWTKRFFEIVQT